MTYLTEETTVTGPVEVWAIPRREWEPETDPPYHYEIRTGNPYVKGAVRVHMVPDVTITIPAGVNLVAKAIETLTKERADAFEEYRQTAARVEKQIQQLVLLSGPVAGSGSPAGTVEVLARDEDEGGPTRVDYDDGPV